MLGWLIPKEFCCGLICAGMLKNLNTSTALHARMVYLLLTLVMGFVCLMAKAFGKDLYAKTSFLTPSCTEGLCFSTSFTHAVMLSLALFHIVVICIASLNKEFTLVCYQKFWVLKFLIYCLLLCACIFMTSILVLFT
jgi:hypothetical protein